MPRSSAEDQTPVYSFPTNPKGEFSQAMSAIASNASDNTKGTFSNLSQGGETFKDEITQALALQLNLTTTQRANEKALAELAKTSGKTAGLKEAIQSRAALYGELLDPS